MGSSQTIQVNPLYAEQYGTTSASKETMRKYGQALLIIAAADGEVAPAERDWLVRTARAYGTPEDVLDEYQSFDPNSAKLDDLAKSIDSDTGSMASNAKLIYDAISICSADGDYSSKERAKVLWAAALLRVPDDIVLQLHALVELEASVTKLRKAVFQTETLSR